MKVGDLVKDKVSEERGIIADEVKFPYPHFMVVWFGRGKEWVSRNFLEVISES